MNRKHLRGLEKQSKCQQDDAVVDYIENGSVLVHDTADIEDEDTARESKVCGSERNAGAAECRTTKTRWATRARHRELKALGPVAPITDRLPMSEEGCMLSRYLSRVLRHTRQRDGLRSRRDGWICKAQGRACSQVCKEEESQRQEGRDDCGTLPKTKVCLDSQL